MNKEFTIRRMSAGLFYSTLTIVLIFWGICGYLLKMLYLEESALLEILTTIYTILFFIPLIVLLIIDFHLFFTKIAITTKGISITPLFGKKQYIYQNEITAIGYISLAANDVKIYICSASTKQILDFCKNRQKNFVKMFGQKRFEEMKKSERDYWEMAVAVYARYSKSKHICYIYDTSQQHLNRIVEILEKERVDTGQRWKNMR